jgi:prolyl-tRNA editing enzyme YbaK/EbsC (Cys-tRNA(Pro) deacylase)
MHPASQKVLDAARRLGIQIDIRQFDQSTRTAQDAADAIGVSLGQIVKSLVFLADGQPVLVLASGPNLTLPVYFDRDLLQYDSVWAAAGTPNTVFAVEPGRLAKASGAIIADIKED